VSMQRSIPWREVRPSVDAGIRLGVVGDPVKHSLSPRMHSAALDALAIKGEYLPIHVPAGELDDAVAHLIACGFRGINVTLPHKAEAADIGIPDDEIVTEIRVANCLAFGEEVHARNTDVPGFLAPLDGVPAGEALVLGAGGAAAAAAYALLRSGWSVSIWSRTQERAYDLAEALEQYGDCDARDLPSPSGCSLVVNATPLGLNRGEMPPLDWDALKPNAIVYDLAYRDVPTDLLMEASRKGNRTVDGREMLVEQGALSLEWWLEVRAPRDAMRQAVGL
jgi:shikimate dehydrogenase